MKKVLLHTCCAPCLTSVHEQLLPDHAITLFWFNPNIEPKSEHDKRLETLRQYSDLIGAQLIADYNYPTENKRWHRFIAGTESEPERGERCLRCFQFRLEETRKMATKLGLETFTTTLSVSPYKDSKTISQIGQGLGKVRESEFLNIDFGENDGYKRSLELSKKHNLYRQKYCGCQYSNSANKTKTV